MKSVPRPSSNDLLYRRIDEMPMGPADRERAKAHLRSAERHTDAVCDLVAAIRSSAVSIAGHVRAAFAPSPQH